MQNKFDEYLLKEYEQIANAHFNTINTISSFFRYYAVLMAVPIPLGAAILPFILTNKEISPELKIYSNLIFGSIFLTLPLVGIFISRYLVSLRHDSLLYARTVNGIRKYFYYKSGLSQLQKISIRTLPHSIYIPDYEDTSFSPVIWVFSIIHCGYLIVGLFLINDFANIQLNKNLYSVGTVAILFFILHFLFFKRDSRKRENDYLVTNKVGVDIDGVLNKHREHFCKMLYDKKNIIIHPDQITHIPVHEAGLQITKEDEEEILNDPRYWTQMPLDPDAPSQLEKLSSSLGKIVWIYTERAWPITKKTEKKKNRSLWLEWKKEILIFIDEMDLNFYFRNKEKFICYYLYCTNKNKLINQVTKLWLKKHNLKYDKLTVENKNILFGRKNSCRFSSSKSQIQYFIEDDPEKAIKLSMLCDFVFLIEHPYNEKFEMPNNIARVKNWVEIFKKLRLFSL